MLQGLNLRSTRVGDAGLARLAALTQLQYLELGQTRVGDAGLTPIRSLPSLWALGLHGTRVTDAGLASISEMSKLASINLSNTGVTDAGLDRLGAVQNLRHVNLNNTRLTDAGLAHLGALKQLQRLSLNDTRVTDAGLARLVSAPPPPLTVLELNRSRVSAAGAAAVRGVLPGAHLDWSEPNRRAAEAVLAAGGSVRVRTAGRGDPAPVEAAANLPADYFRLSRAGLGGGRRPPREVLQLLAALTDPEFDDLEELDLSGSAADDDDLKSLTGLPCRRLVLDGAPVRGPGLVHLKHLPRLTDLRLGCPALSFLGVSYAGQLKGLRQLSLAGSGATDASLRDLHGLAALRELDLTGTKVTAEGVAELRQALPTCAIKAGPAGP
jgi:Leucine-rich repeat (LRR) protein